VVLAEVVARSLPLHFVEECLPDGTTGNRVVDLVVVLNFLAEPEEWQIIQR